MSTICYSPTGATSDATVVCEALRHGVFFLS